MYGKNDSLKLDLEHVDLLDTRSVPLDGAPMQTIRRRIRLQVDDYHARGGQSKFATHYIPTLDLVALLRIE